MQHAVAFAEEVRDVRPLPKSSERDDKIAEARANPGIFDAFRKANARKFQGFDAPEYNIRAIEAAVGQALCRGRARRAAAVHGADDRHAGRAPSNISSSPSARPRRSTACPEGTQPREIRRVGVIGAGTMGGGISMNFLSRRHPGDDRRDGAGRARPRHRRDAQELRGERRQGPDERRPGRGRDGPAEADARPRGSRRLRPDHRGGVREYGREEGDFRQARQDRQAGRDPRLQHLLSQHRRDRGVDLAAAGRGRPALLLAGQCDEAAGGGARREDRARRAGDRDAARQEDQEGRGGRGRLPRLHRQPHADAAPGRGDEVAARRRDARADRQGPCRFRHADGPVPDVRPRRRRHRLAPRSDPDREYPRRARRRGPLGPEEGRRLLRL